MRVNRLLSASLLVLVLLAGAARSEEAPAAAPAPADAPATVVVTRGPFTVVAELEGAFEARERVEIRWEPRVFSGELDVIEAVPPGPVVKGQWLVRVDAEPIDEQIEAAERDLRIAGLALAARSAEMDRQEETARIAAERERESARVAAESLRIFRETELPLQLAQADLSIQSSRDWIQDQTEELEQLVKMYESDDLTEETEEIVMRRARRDLDRSKQYLGFRLIYDRLMREVYLPRQLRTQELSVRQAENDFARSEAAREPQIEQARLDFEKAKVALRIQERQLDRLRADRAGLELVAPEAGIAVPAELVRGKWNGLDAGAKAMKKGGKLRPNAVLYTIVRPGEVSVATSVKEGDLWRMKEGLDAVVVPAADAKTKLAAKVAAVNRFSEGDSFEVRVELGAKDERILPGNTCKVKVTISERPNALTVPADAIRTDGEATVVFVVTEGAPRRTEVETGATSGGRTEILSGVPEGARILATPPKED